MPEITVVRAKRYLQSEFRFEKIIPPAFILALCEEIQYDENLNPVYCDKGYDVKTSFTKYISWAGYGAAKQEYPWWDYNIVKPGDNVSVTISPDVTINFQKVTSSGNVAALITSERPLSGYVGMTDNTVLDIWTDAGFTGQAKVSTKYTTAGLSPNQISMAKMYRIIDPAIGNYQELNTDFDTVNQTASANVNSFGKFLVATPEYQNPQFLASSRQAENIPPSVYPDGISPETVLSFYGPTYPTADGTYVSTRTNILFAAQDPQVPDVITSGVKLTNYILDPSEAELTISTYAEPFALTEGTHTIYYLSVDNEGNYEFPQNTTFYADGTPPETTLAAGGLLVAGGLEDWRFGGTAYITETDSITLRANDLVSNNVASGVKAVIFLVDLTSSQCAGHSIFQENPPEPLQFFGPPGTCDNPIYTEPFTLLVGTHTVYYASIDNVANQEQIKTANIIVNPKDTEPPVTLISFAEPKFITAISTYITGGTSITFTAIDLPAIGFSGVKKTGYRVEGVGYSSEEILYTEPFTLAKVFGVPETLPGAESRIAYWNFDEGSGNTAIDASGNNNNGTVFDKEIFY